MGRPKSTRPTDAELEVLGHLWKRGSATVRDVHDDIFQDRKVAYTSIATIMRIMIDKAFVEILDKRRPQRFKAIIAEDKARKGVTDEWLHRMFGGSVVSLVKHALMGRKLSKAQAAELKKLIDDLR